MAYIFKLRRGTKYVDNNGTTLTDGSGNAIRDDWSTYSSMAGCLIPQEGELVLEYEYNPITRKKTPRLKIGDGVHRFAELDYISVDSFVLPTPTTITLLGGAANWTEVTGYTNRYTQDVTAQLAGKVTANSKVDLQPTPEQLAAFHAKDVAFTTVNEDGNITVCAIGIMPEGNYEGIQVTITEVVENG